MKERVRFPPKAMDIINHTYYINGEPVLLHDTHRDLGILMSHNLSWNAHYRYILSNAYCVEPALACLLCPQNKRSHYLSLVKSKLMYNSPVWRPQFIKDITVIEQVQRCAILNIFYVTTH